MLVTGKGNKERAVPIGRKLAAALFKYRIARPSQVTEHFFITRLRATAQNIYKALLKPTAGRLALRGCGFSTHLPTHFCQAVLA